MNKIAAYRFKIEGLDITSVSCVTLMEMSAIFASLESMKVFLEVIMMLESRRKLLRVKLLFNLVESYVGLKSYFFLP